MSRLLSTFRPCRRLAISLFVLLSTGCGGEPVAPPTGGVPIITDIIPGTIDAGAGPFTLVLRGEHFASNAAVRWAGNARETHFVSATELYAQIMAHDVASAGSVAVTVENPGDGGGTSAGRSFTITSPTSNPVPVITSIEPDQAPHMGPSFVLTVHGSGFGPSSTIFFQRDARNTVFVDASTLTATITSADLQMVGQASVGVGSPSPGGSESNEVMLWVLQSGLLSLRTLELPVNDLVTDPATGVLFAAVPGTGGARANTLTQINPGAATIGASVFVGSEPMRIARSDDGQYLYVSLWGAAAVRRYNIAAGIAELQFPLGTDVTWGPMYAEDLAVLPGVPHTVAVSTRYVGIFPYHAGVRIYDDGVVRPVATAPQIGSNEIEAESATVLYGANTENTDFGIYAMSVAPNGVSTIDTFLGLAPLGLQSLVLAGGLLYTDGGSVIDPVAGQLVGNFAGARGAFAVDLPNNKVFFLKDGDILIYQASNFASLATIHVGFGSGAHLVRWGTNGLAFTSGPMDHVPGTTVFFLTTSLLPGP